MSTLTIHEPTLHVKVGHAYITDEGQQVPSHNLHRFECSCGWKGSCWYAGQDRARAHVDRHLAAFAPLAVAS